MSLNKQTQVHYYFQKKLYTWNRQQHSLAKKKTQHNGNNSSVFGNISPLHRAIVNVLQQWVKRHYDDWGNCSHPSHDDLLIAIMFILMATVTFIAHLDTIN